MIKFIACVEVYTCFVVFVIVIVAVALSVRLSVTSMVLWVSQGLLKATVTEVDGYLQQ